MNKEAYLENRKALMDEAQNLLNESKTEEAQAKMDEVTALDAKFESEAKMQANLDALTNKTVVAPEARIAEKTSNEAEDMFDSAEYKQSFMNYIVKGTAIPAKFVNTDATTKTTDVAAVIPTSTIQKIYEKMDKLGLVLAEVTRLSVKAGVSVPTSASKPSASWVAEGSGSDRQKKTTSTVAFLYHKLRCEISMSFEVANLAYPMFEETFVRNVADAMVKAKEKAIISGTGATYHQPKGILSETAALDIEVAEGSHLTYAQLCEAEGAQYDDNAIWCMTKKTYMSEIAAMVDENGQPVARVNYGLSGRPEYTILGRRVLIAHPDYMSSWAASVTSDAVIAFMFNFKDYLFNSPVSMTTKRYTDNDTDEECIKAIELCDGAAALADSLVTVTLKNA